MININNFKKYDGQALAIAMVILVVSSLIAISIYSRTMKDKGLSLEERASAEALEVSDILLDRLSQFPMSTVIDSILEMDIAQGITEYPYSTGILLRENSSETGNNITTLLRSESLKILDESQTISEFLTPLCPIDQGNEYQVTLKEADPNTYYEIKPGNIWSLPVRNLIKQDGCALNLKLAVRGDTRAGFVLMKIYCNYDENGNVTNCKEYDFGGLGDEYTVENDDIVNYCFSNEEESECNNPNFRDSENWEKYYPGSGRYIEAGIFGDDSVDPIPVQGVSDTDFQKKSLFERILEIFKKKPVSAQPAPVDPEDLSDYILSEVRIKAIGGTVGISYILPEECLTGLRMFQLRATANCYGVYRGKEVLIPEQKWHNAIFDYVIFNGEGSL